MIKVVNRLVYRGFAKVEFHKVTPCELWNKVKDKLTDWQEMVDLYNTISFERFKEHDWSTAIPDSLKERVNNFLCRDFYLKYNLVKKSDNETENKS